jgi:hypothetical protein
LGQSRALTLQLLLEEHRVLTDRLQSAGNCRDATDVWRSIGVAHPERVVDMEAAEVQDLRSQAWEEA